MSEQGHNGFNATTVNRFLGEVLRVHDKLDEAKIEHMNNCREIREPIKRIEKQAKDAGIPLAAFRALIKSELAERAYKRAIDKARPNDEDDADAWDALREIAAEGKPDDLFSHAVKKHDEEDEDRDLRPRTLREKEDDAAKKNAKLIEEGISELDDGLGDD